MCPKAGEAGHVFRMKSEGIRKFDTTAFSYMKQRQEHIEPRDRDSMSA